MRNNSIVPGEKNLGELREPAEIYLPLDFTRIDITNEEHRARYFAAGWNR
jgi:hypothetical protein